MIQTHVPQQTASKSEDKEEEQTEWQTEKKLWLSETQPQDGRGTFLPYFNQQKSCCVWKPAQAQVCTKHIFAKLNRHFCLHHVKIILHTFAQASKSNIVLNHLSYSNYTVRLLSVLSYFNFSSTIGLGCRDITDFTFLSVFFHQRLKAK